MREHYIHNKVHDLEIFKLDCPINSEAELTKLHLSTKLNNYIELSTNEFKNQLCGYIFHVLQKEFSK